MSSSLEFEQKHQQNLYYEDGTNIRSQFTIARFLRKIINFVQLRCHSKKCMQKSISFSNLSLVPCFNFPLANAKWTEYYCKYVLHLLKQTWNMHLQRCSADLLVIYEMLSTYLAIQAIPGEYTKGTYWEWKHGV